MIKNKNDLLYYLEADKVALGISKKKPFVFSNSDIIWRFEILLRKTEYYYNKVDAFSKLLFKIYSFFLGRLSLKLSFSIPLNVFGPGLSIAHYGTIVVNKNAKIGKNCRIQEGVNIGATNGNNEAPLLGDNIFIGTGAKLLGNIKIGNNVCIGANAVVTKSFPDNITIAGVPAKKISDNNSIRMLQKKLVNSSFFCDIFESED